MNAPVIIQGTAAVRIDPASVPGWGIDADTENDPTYPYRERENDDHSGMWNRPTLQNAGVEVLQSVEHIRRPAVVGTSTPPSGLSGEMRRAAFRWSESNLLHWMILLGADRVNMVEGLIGDFARGKIPNILAEMGIRAELQHNKVGLLKKVVIGAGVLGAVSLFASKRRRR